MDNKKKIFYTREYRHMKNTPLTMIVELIFTIVPFLVILRVCYSRFSLWLSEVTKEILSSIFHVNAEIAQNDALAAFDPVFYVNLPGRKPRFTMSIVMLVVVLFLLIVVLQVFDKYKSFMIYMGIFLGILLMSDIYFIFWGDKFPYTLGTYASMYMLQQVIMWFAIALVSVVALSVLPGIHGSVLIAFWSIMLYSLIYGSVRYIVFIVFLYWATNVFMAPLFFMCGVFLDFMYVVAIYAIYARRISRKFSKREEMNVWEW